MASAARPEPQQKTLAGGSFFGAVQKRSEHSAAIFTELSHSTPRKLPEHSHELAFFALILLHVGAALFHALIRRDTVFESMATVHARTEFVPGE